MSDKPVFMTSRELATRLLRDATDFEVAHVATALEEMASWHMERRGRVLVQIAGVIETPPINMDTLSIEQDNIPGRGRSGILDPARREVELPLANAMHQLDA